MRMLDVITIALGVVAAAFPAQAFLYQIDDGTQESSFGSGPSFGTGLMLLNRFEEVPGAELVTDIGGVWGNMADGNPVTLILYDDPNDDGNPIDATLLTEIGVMGGPIGTEFLLPITPTVISGTFFVAMLYDTQSGSVGATAIDDDTPAMGRTWFSITPTIELFDRNDLSNNADVAPASDTFFGDPTAMLRAQAPEPDAGALALAALGVLAVLAAWRPPRSSTSAGRSPLLAARRASQPPTL